MELCRRKILLIGICFEETKYKIKDFHRRPKVRYRLCCCILSTFTVSAAWISLSFWFPGCKEIGRFVGQENSTHHDKMIYYLTQVGPFLSVVHVYLCFSFAVCSFVLICKFQNVFVDGGGAAVIAVIVSMYFFLEWWEICVVCIYLPAIDYQFNLDVTKESWLAGGFFHCTSGLSFYYNHVYSTRNCKMLVQQKWFSSNHGSCSFEYEEQGCGTHCILFLRM